MTFYSVEANNHDKYKHVKFITKKELQMLSNDVESNAETNYLVLFDDNSFTIYMSWEKYKLISAQPALGDFLKEHRRAIRLGNTVELSPRKKENECF